ncbi:hypothetical protein HispidOSU_003730, partial [Sigmodon hispidus]
MQGPQGTKLGNNPATVRRPVPKTPGGPTPAHRLLSNWGRRPLSYHGGFLARPLSWQLSA